MPKPFMLGIEVEEIALGKVMRVLNKLPGVVKLHMDLQPKAKANGIKRGPYKKRGEFEVTGSHALTTLLQNEGPLATRRLKEHFEAQGRSGNSVNSILFAMKKKGEIENKDNVWSLSKKMKDRLRHRKGND